ncbi:MAG: hypothetical protein JRJ12_00015 [Deltaproteobacteria bacterium]|nr:hypothetical protein [Deltaproteobacteria bacterium]MBW2069748.1 hypothetical protein [Deltaproteobacteria bacterium]
MACLSRAEFDLLIKDVQQDSIASVYLFHGDSYLVSTALEQFLQVLLPPATRDTNLLVVEGRQADFAELLQGLNTFNLFPGRKAVVVRDCRLFYSRANLSTLFLKCKDEYESGDVEAAARLLLEILAYAGWSLEQWTGGAWRTVPANLWQHTLKVDKDEQSLAWLDQVLSHITANDMQIPPARDDGPLLQAALQQGFPAGHCLVLTTDAVDKRRALYREIEKQGVVVDFSVATGTNRQARKTRETLLKDVAASLLEKGGKRIQQQALSLLLEHTGFNLWALRSQLEKLISYAGDQTTITTEHVASISDYCREEPLYELNSALASGDTLQALAILQRLLDQGYHPLQVVATLANEVRRLIAAREIIDIHLQGRFAPETQYNTFQRKIAPLLKKHIAADSPLKQLHPFVLYKTMARSCRFSATDLVQALLSLQRADLAIKSTAVPARIIIEDLLLNLLAPMPGKPSPRLASSQI